MRFVNPFKRNSNGQFEDVIKLRGRVEVGLYDPEGKLLEYRRQDNTVVTSGRSYVLSRIQSSSPQADVINAIAVGTSITAPTTGDTLLNSEVSSTNSGRLAIALFVTGGLTNNPPSWQAQVTYATNQANTTLGEAGLFNSTGNNSQTMLSHVTFATINKTTSNTLAISYTISN